MKPKYLILLLHVVLAIASIGVAIGASETPDLAPIIVKGLGGLAFGLGLTAFVHLLIVGYLLIVGSD